MGREMGGGFRMGKSYFPERGQRTLCGKAMSLVMEEQGVKDALEKPETEMETCASG